MGSPPLKEMIMQNLSKKGLDVTDLEIMITAGGESSIHEHCSSFMRCFGYSRWKLDMYFVATGYLTQIKKIKMLTPFSFIYDGSHYRTLLLQSQAGASA